MKKTILLFMSVLFVQITFSQSITASGTVKNENGDPIPATLVSEFKSKPAAATYTDTLGFFSFSVGKFSKLSVSCKGYNDTLVNLTDKKNISITLSKAKTPQQSDNTAANADNSVINNNLLQDAVATQSGINNNYVYGGAVRNYTGSLMPVFTYKEETKGSRYLFNAWTPGSVTNTDNSVFGNPEYLYNYDKIEGGLLLTHDKQSAIEVDKVQIKAFNLIAGTDDTLTFENIPAVDAAHFVQVLSSGTKYKIYKLTKTKFVKSNYHTDGIATIGNPYDEYVDENSYYLSTIKDNKIEKISLKKKVLKEVFAGEEEKLKQFFKDYNNDQINDVYLINLGNYLNK